MDRLRTKLTRRELIKAGVVAPLATACTPKRAPDLVIPDRIGDWRIWGTQTDTPEVNFRSGEYVFNIHRRALLASLAYPYEVSWDFYPYRGLFVVQYANTQGMRILGGFGESDGSKYSLINQWTHTISQPNLILAHTVFASYSDLIFKRVDWDGRTVMHRP